jgi:hypothetical protein
MTSKVFIIGGGFLGQMIQYLFWPKARVFDWRSHAPSILSRKLGPQYLWEPIPELPCKTFMVQTTVDGKEATEASIRAYKEKVGKEQDGADWRAQFRPWMRGYECAYMPHVPVEYGQRIVALNFIDRQIRMMTGECYRYDYLISTIPLPALLTLGGYKTNVPFQFRRIYIHRAVIGLPSADTNFHVNYISFPHSPVYRQTIRDGQIFTESLEPLPQPDTTVFAPGKIYAHPDAENIVADLRDARVLCFGRYAAWRPDELAHETFQHIRDYQRSANYVFSINR